MSKARKCEYCKAKGIDSDLIKLEQESNFWEERFSCPSCNRTPTIRRLQNIIAAGSGVVTAVAAVAGLIIREQLNKKK